MKKIFFVFVFIIGLVSLTTSHAFAQMMGTGTSVMQYQVSITPSAQDMQDIQTGQDLYTRFQNKQVSCTNLQDSDFEKIGEYLMQQQFSNTTSHIQMNERMKSMMGDQGEERMHTAIARSVTNCNTNSQQGGVQPMMGWNGVGFGNMMNGNFGWGFGILHIVIAVIILIDLILAGIWLWKQLKKNTT